ncbi:FAD-dependent oxidoreductase [Fictibacillus gelatini]|uniref:FAD-dependent oxidoreductase n=1 Tax=Fictibacillus gelatini TaxID=225985 RepID=UPI00041957E4|nr:FAD-dependent oxidoreductase [Fictibacillus gelatini]
MTDNYKDHKQMPQFPEPYWRESAELPRFNQLEEDIDVHIAIVGGGISGITTAYLLIKEGFKVAMIDAGNLLNGTTGHTTAKITAQHGLIYDELISNIGEEKARNYYDANIEAMKFIQSTIQENHIDCDFSEEDAYIFTNDDQYVDKLKKEIEAYRKLGINGEFLESLPLDFSIKAAVKMNNQAQFHPLKYLKKLIEDITNQGGLIFENTTAVRVERGDRPVIYTRDGHAITCDQLISCSHFPFYDGGFYFSRMYAERSYVIAVKTEKEYPGGMYINAEQPTRSLRYTMHNGEKLLLIGGENHKTGQGIPTIQHYEALEEFANETFGIKDYLFRWSTQDLTTLDKIPYVGRISSGKPNIFVATGYRKWGMTNSTAAALLLRDLIIQKENRYEELYTPSRFDAEPSVKNFLIQNADVAKHLIEGKLEYALRSADDLENDEGSVVNVDGKRAGAYKDEKGEVHLVDTTCTHMGCEIEWNSGDRTWDCPCHGSRFSITGEVIEGPAKRPLKKIDPI